MMKTQESKTVMWNKDKHLLITYDSQPRSLVLTQGDELFSSALDENFFFPYLPQHTNYSHSNSYFSQNSHLALLLLYPFGSFHTSIN